MNEMDNFLGAKDFSYFVPGLLQDIEIQDLLKKELNQLDVEAIIKETELNDEVYGFLHDYITENAPEIDGVEVNLNEDSEPSDYGIYVYIIRGMKGVFFTESADDDTRFFDSFDKARASIELNHGIELDDNNEVDKGSLAKRISAAEAITKVLKIMKKI